MTLNKLWQTDVPTLRKMCRKNGISYAGKNTKTPLIKLLAEHKNINFIKEKHIQGDAKELDQYFTKESVAKECIKETKAFFKEK